MVHLPAHLIGSLFESKALLSSNPLLSLFSTLPMKNINYELVILIISALMIQAISRDDYDRFQGLVNNLRSQYNAGPLCYNDKLMKSAKMQSVDQYNLGNMQHEGADGSSSFERAQRAGFKYPSKVSENVAAGQTSVSSVFEDWRDSPGKNLLLFKCDSSFTITTK